MLQSWPVNSDSRYEPSSTIVLSEAFKLAISSIWVGVELLLATTPSSSPSFLSIVRNGHHKATVPAILYTLAMTCQTVGAYNLDLLPYLMLSQLKIIITPIFSALLMKQKFGPDQWLCLAMITTGTVLVQIGSVSPRAVSLATSPNSPNAILGVLAMLIAGCCVAFAGVYMEMILKSSSTVMVRNAQLGLYSFFVALSLHWGRHSDFKTFFHGYHALVWLLVILQTIGGFLVALCVRFTSAVAKNYAQGLGFLIASIVPVLDSSQTVFQLLCGIALVSGAVFRSAWQARIKARPDSIIDKQETSNV
ncbi:nucleotide-sugar transporter-domain-containing protein [Bisporella sp. PMI_857]|nr:nucleotide-sugar transporter-domain-containing protein [Bisporella sp. PMI_857]